MNPTYELDDGGAWIKYWTPAESQVFPYFRASGGMLSSIFDYARWLDIWSGGTQLPGQQGLRADRLLSAELHERALQSYGGDEIGDYGYHWEIYGDDPLIFGHGGSDGTLGVAVPAENLLLLYFTQSRGNDTRAIWREAALAATRTN